MTNKRAAIEIATWPCSEEYVKDQSIICPGLKMLDGQGLDEIYYGIQVEKTNAYCVINWHAMEDHVNFTADKERLYRFFNMFTPSAKDGVPEARVIHVSLEASATLPCLEAPVTEIRKVKAREGVSLEAVQAALDKYVNKLTTEGVNATYGQVIENPEELVVVIGRKAIEGPKDGEEEKEIRGITEVVEDVSVWLKQY